MDVTDENIRGVIKSAGIILDYPGEYGIDIEQLDMHFLLSGGDNELLEARCLGMKIQKIGRWRGGTFKEYIQEELMFFSRVCQKSWNKSLNLSLYHEWNKVNL